MISPNDLEFSMFNVRARIFCATGTGIATSFWRRLNHQGWRMGEGNK